MNEYEEDFLERFVNRCANNVIKSEIESKILLIDLDKLSVENLDEMQGSIHMFFIRINKMRAFKLNKLNEKIAGME